MPVVVYFDLETTGLSYSAQVLQIGARCAGNKFNRYILPTGNVYMEPQASAINGLDIYQGRLRKNGVPVHAGPAYDVWSDFISYLDDCGEGEDVVLTAHNGFLFDHPVTMRSVKQLGLRKALLKVAPLGSDTTYVFPAKDRFVKLTNIAQKYGVPTYNAHDALGDVDMMRRLCRELHIADEDIIDRARPLASFG